MRNICTSNCRIAWTALGLACSLGSIAFGANQNAVAIENISTDLKIPHGVAIRPEGSGEAYEIFVAESGAGRVVKFQSDKPEKRIDVVAGFSNKPATDDSPTSPGVHSLYFLDHMRLVVTGGNDDSTPFVRLYELPEPASPLAADQHKQEANVPEIGKDPNFNAHVFRSIARTQANDRVGDILLVAAPVGGDAPGLVYVPVRSGTLGDAVPARIKNAGGGLQIGGIAVGKNGYVIVAISETADSSRPSRLAFFSPLDRRIVMQMPTDLQRIVAIAYNPKSGNLFVANSPTADDGRAGIYRVDSVSKPGAPACTAVKVADVRGATSLAFAPDGALYVTATGDLTSKNAGVLLKLSGNL
jgi:WD40 repeat protein